MKMLLLAAFLLANPTGLMDGLAPSPRPETMDISAVRYLDCGDWVGSGFLIADKLLVTALHVAKDTVCTDVASGGKLMMYKYDSEHDLALLTGPSLPTDIPYVKYSCRRFVTGQPYLSYGVTFYNQPRPITRMNVIVATSDYTDSNDLIGETPSPGLRIFNQHIAPGMSGGPVTDLNGYALAVNNAGSDTDTLLYEFADGILCK